MEVREILRCKFCGRKQPPWKVHEYEIYSWFTCAYCGRVNRFISG